ncbi:glycerophosphoryl diester phosphodiesterase [Actinomycetaceae bacterium WB03_NA08]|uniref:Glycerophosphoryl diester phosphodiesterase n=1 Tax=Scrofimicrobium canadense TaxID=2652290 RepID=A0A6N7W569_9ACTO|nr:glycerophosphodiester phosphodiesterase family protein [Scrofimicrobium canadense]MSS83366.1 glycerophosphoryl diester phosphodiesterase [Scrofimicrobium canadense]
MEIIAHRGVSSLAPENTMAAFVKCLDLGVQWFEFDVQLLGDASLVVMHDDTADRTTNGTGQLQDMSFDEARRLDAGLWFGPEYRFERIPELTTVVDLLNTTALCANLEVKYTQNPQLRDSLVEAVSRIASGVKDQSKLLISSFDPTVLSRMQDFATAFLVEARTVRADFHGVVQRALDLGCVAIHPEEDSVGPAQVQAWHDAGLKVNVWTVNDKARAQEFYDMGVDGLITDRPQDFLSLDTN